MRALFVVLYSRNFPHYDENRKLLEALFRGQDWLDAYFVERLPDVLEPHLAGSFLRLPGTDGFHQILGKTLDAFGLLLPAGEYDFVVRTNLSTLWNLPRLRETLEAHLGQTNLFLGVENKGFSYKFICGFAMIWSADVVRQMIAERLRNPDLINGSRYLLERADDVLLSKFCLDRKIPMRPLSFCVCSKPVASFEGCLRDACVYRCRLEPDELRSLEPRHMAKLAAYLGLSASTTVNIRAFLDGLRNVRS